MPRPATEPSDQELLPAYVQYVQRIREQLDFLDGDTLDTQMIVMGAIRLGHIATTQADRLVLRPLGLTFSRFRLLFAISTIGPMTSVELADCFDNTKPTIAKLLESLEALELITRSPHPSDGRAAIIQNTPKGERLLGEALTQQRVFERQFFGHLTREERGQLADLLSRAIADPTDP
ncbi:MAG: winged helix-turn-helix transcriptional regulator [Actinomycetia bacterium]|nr:winged helix-turn-helix transcriptional regulator [Actinomycetes bacterium]MCP5035448.1 winged helix-turn-helix transcriptional regulator [Actinomycetes bacterium]